MLARGALGKLAQGSWLCLLDPGLDSLSRSWVDALAKSLKAKPRVPELVDIVEEKPLCRWNLYPGEYHLLNTAWGQSWRTGFLSRGTSEHLKARPQWETRSASQLASHCSSVLRPP